jgi:hypothetical protein
MKIMSMYGFHTALELLNEMRRRITSSKRMNEFEKQFQCQSLDALINLVELNYHAAMQQCAEQTEGDAAFYKYSSVVTDDVGFPKYSSGVTIDLKHLPKKLTSGTIELKSGDELEHEAEQACSRLEVAFGSESEDGKWN